MMWLDQIVISLQNTLFESDVDFVFSVAYDKPDLIDKNYSINTDI